LSATVKAMRKQDFNRIPYSLFVVGILNSLLLRSHPTVLSFVLLRPHSTVLSFVLLRSPPCTVSKSAPPQDSRSSAQPDRCINWFPLKIRPHSLAARFSVLGRISSPRTKLLAARCECMHEHFHPITMLSKGLIPRALFLGEMRNISPVSFEL
jgi:hypothetical protein